MGFKNWIKKWWSGGSEAQLVDHAKGTSVGAMHRPAGGAFSADGNVYEDLAQTLSIDGDLMYRYIDYENMDDYPETSASLDIYSDDTTIPDSIHGKSIWSQSQDKVIRDIIDDCLHRRLKIEEDIWIAVRTLVKYGNLFGEIVVTEVGVVGINWLPTPTVRRIVNPKGVLLGFVQDLSGQFNYSFRDVVKSLEAGKLPELAEDEEHLTFFYPWEIVHWRLRSKMIRSQYGFSVLDAARWVYKRLQMMEDTALVQKLTRAPGRFAFYVDTGDLPPKEAMALVRQVKIGFKKKKLIDPSTGKLDHRYNPLSPHEDMWIPTRGGKESTRVEVIAGPDVQMMDDVEYFQKKMVTATKVPRQYLGMGEGDETRATLSQTDVRFARACMRVQREFIVGIRKLIRVHMAALNIDPDSVEWKIKMTVPSSIFEMQQIEVMNAQAELANALSEYMPKQWILKHILHLTDDDAAHVTSDKNAEEADDMKREAATQSDIARMYPGVVVEPEDEGAMGEDVEGVKKRLEEVRAALRESNESSLLMMKKINSMKPQMRRTSKRPYREK
jgi:hypothetical protein